MANKNHHSIHVFLLAGGSGTRFWPRSRANNPKQFLDLAGDRSMIQETWDRLLPVTQKENMWVIAPDRLEKQVRKHLPKLPKRNLVLEPSPRDTAPAIALACEQLYRRDPNAIAAIFPTDHVIRDTKKFHRAVLRAAKAAEKDALVCLGIKPTYPATGYGYLKCSNKSPKARVREVDRFVEKPDLSKAKRFVASGNYLWNGGMFVWRVDQFLETLGKTAPQILSAVRKVVDGKTSAWTRATRLSVDYAVMEKASNVQVVPLNAGWDDVGSWAAVSRLRAERGLEKQQHILVDSPNAQIIGDHRTIAVVGCPGLTVVDTGDAILIVSEDETERVKSVVSELKSRGRDDLL